MVWFWYQALTVQKWIKLSTFPSKRNRRQWWQKNNSATDSSVDKLWKPVSGIWLMFMWGTGTWKSSLESVLTLSYLFKVKQDYGEDSIYITYWNLKTIFKIKLSFLIVRSAIFNTTFKLLLADKASVILRSFLSFCSLVLLKGRLLCSLSSYPLIIALVDWSIIVFYFLSKVNQMH